MSDYTYRTKSTEELKQTLRNLQARKRTESTGLGVRDIMAEMKVITRILQKRGV